MKVNFILNPVAGRGHSLEVLPRIRKILNEEQVEYEVYRTQYSGNGSELARELEERGEVITAIGGDGTVREVLNGVRSPRTPIGIIPAGMGNDFARSLGIPSNPTEATKCIINSNRVKVDLGSERGKLFNVMGVGFPADVVKTINRYKNGFIDGSIIYLLGLLRSLTQLKTYRLQLETNGESSEIDASAVFVANSNFTAGGINLVPHARLRDGLLDVAVISDVGRRELVLALKNAYQGTHVNHPKIEFYQAKSVNINTGDKLPLMFDGELEGTTPAQLEIAPEARTLIVPPESMNKLKKQ